MAFAFNRFSAFLLPDSGYQVDIGQASFGAMAIIDGIPFDGNFLNESPLSIGLSLATNRFTLSGGGQDGKGNAVTLQLEGEIVNHPPIANPGPNRFIECNGHGQTSLALDATQSSDTDPFNVLSHFQWFENGSGLGNREVESVLESFGPGIGGAHTYELHVYDQNLASSQADVTETIRDTTPPVVSGFSYSGPSCLWLPNHKYVVLRVGRDFQATVQDVCDPRPTFVIESATSSEPPIGAGSGNTSPDLIVFPDHVALSEGGARRNGSRGANLHGRSRRRGFLRQSIAVHPRAGAGSARPERPVHPRSWRLGDRR